jgi:hypothetical protein
LLWRSERRNEPLTMFNWRALRHFGISCWIDAGLLPKTVQTFAGHSSLQITMDRYGHLFQSKGRVASWTPFRTTFSLPHRAALPPGFRAPAAASIRLESFRLTKSKLPRYA